MPRLGQPKYRATFRDKPFTVARHHPGEDPHGRPADFYGRVYYENGPPQFKYEGPPKNELYWLERDPYLPSFNQSRATSAKSQGGNLVESMRGLNVSPVKTAASATSATSSSRQSPAMVPKSPQTTRSLTKLDRINVNANNFTTTYKVDYANPTKRQTMDGVGFL